MMCPSARCAAPLLVLAPLLAAQQEGPSVLEAAIARVTPAVCTVMPLQAEAGGSGVVIDPAGFVLTNFHVVGKPEVKTMKVGLADGTLHLADVLGIDPGSDLAVLCLRPKDAGAASQPHGTRPDRGGAASRPAVPGTVPGAGLVTAPAPTPATTASAPVPRPTFPFAPFGDSDELLAGEEVFAMGHPFHVSGDFQPTVTRGIVSGTHRYQQGQGDRFLVYPDCIQIDAPVNPGNSGGPLFNRHGQIVGINGRIAVGERGRVNVGVGFAVASRQILNFLPDLLRGRHVEHGTLDLNAWFGPAPGEPKRHGVFVQATFRDSLAAAAGVGLGDEIVSFQGVPVRSANQLATMVGILPAGHPVRLGFRKKLDGGGYGPVQEITLRLPRLDTGSSRDENRIAGPEHLELASAAMARLAVQPEVAAVRPAGAWGVDWGAPPARAAAGRALPREARRADLPFAFVERAAASPLERAIESLLPTLVKVHGASGVRTIRPYASGLLVSPDGHVLTIEQVMLQSGSTRVVLADGSVHEATLLDVDERLGLRLLRIAAGRPLPFVDAGAAAGTGPSRAAPRPGDQVFSLGNPFRIAEFAEKPSVTFGVLSARIRSGLRFRLQEVPYDGDLWLTDAANNPGNEGGGLFALDGSLVGVNWKVVDSTETNTQLSLAVPADLVLGFLGKALPDRYGAAARALAAASGTGPGAGDTPAKAPPGQHGIRLFASGPGAPPFVERVAPGSPGASAGLRPDDLILRVDDDTVFTVREFRDAMAKRPAGTKVALTVRRGGAVRTVTLILAEARE
ncbi:MAG: trypsin-like peptidase domain-containing protein [Planctomycetes bacterium]|nr:trypsin-like peptidase domain-containing protein [Planctomycetota bacterium]